MSEIKTSDYKCRTNTRNHVVSLRRDHCDYLRQHAIKKIFEFHVIDDVRERPNVPKYFNNF